MIRFAVLVWTVFATAVPTSGFAQSASGRGPSCQAWKAAKRNPSAAELRCQYGVRGWGRFGLLSYMDVPVYQPSTPLPGTHVIGIPGLPRPDSGESYEAWEWRMLRTQFGPEATRVHRGTEVLDPFFATRLMQFERRLTEAGVRAYRRETWRAPERQAYIFQQGRSRPGPIATATLTSWHSRRDARGQPAGRAADYNVGAGQLGRFHEIAREMGLGAYGADSNDPGHVYMPGDDVLPDADVIMLRLLPRVPHVTLATGRPVDEMPVRPRGELLREAAAWVRQPFVPDYGMEVLRVLRSGPPR